MTKNGQKSTKSLTFIPRASAMDFKVQIEVLISPFSIGRDVFLGSDFLDSFTKGFQVFFISNFSHRSKVTYFD